MVHKGKPVVQHSMEQLRLAIAHLCMCLCVCLCICLSMCLCVYVSCTNQWYGTGWPIVRLTNAHLLTRGPLTSRTMGRAELSLQFNAKPGETEKKFKNN